MPIEFWMSEKVGGWFWTARSPNGEIVADSAEVYTSRAKAVNGANATAKEFAKWLKEQKPKTKKATSARQKQGGKPFTSSSNQIRKTAKRGG